MRRIGLSLTGVASCLVLAVVCVIVSTPPMALAKKPPGDKGDKGGGGKTTTAEVTITGPMQTPGPETFLIKDSKRTLTLTRGVWTDQGAVPIRYGFFNTVVEPRNCEELRPDSLILEDHLIDFVVVEDFPDRWGASIVIDKSSLGEFDPDGPNPRSTTNFKGGHSIDVTTDPDHLGFPTPTITGTRERLWIPEGPNKSGLVTVTWLEDSEPGDGTRVRVFEFSDFIIQVWTNTGGNIDRKIMRCYNLDGPIEVTVVTAL